MKYKKIILNDVHGKKIVETSKYKSIAELIEKEKNNLNLSYANLRSANLSSADLSYANLRSADLRSADLSYANLRSADLRSADLSYANLSSADLRAANLSYANLSYANLSSADLSYANLSYANLSYANLRSADLRYAKMLFSFKRKLVSNKFLMDKMFKSTKDNLCWIVYKSFGERKQSPKKWNIKNNMIIKNRIDADRWIESSYGINVGTLMWCKNNCNNQIYKLHVPKTAEICVPYYTDGKVRVSIARIISLERKLVENSYHRYKKIFIKKIKVFK